MRRGEVPAQGLRHRAVGPGDGDEGERVHRAICVEHERAVAVVGEDLIVRDRARDEAGHEALELLGRHRLGVVLHHAEELLAAHEQRERVLVADIHDARAVLRRGRDALVLERTQHGDRAGVRDDRAGRVGLDREEACHVLGRARPNVVGKRAAGDEEATPVLEAEKAVRRFR